MKRVLLLGSTGSIGDTTLAVLTELRESHRIVGLAVGRQADKLASQVPEWRPEAVAISTPPTSGGIPGLDPVRVLTGSSSAAALVELTSPDIVVNGITGAAGLEASLATVRAGLTLALANKESMVMAGPLLGREASRSGATILPVDSEHSAIFQCLHGEDRRSVRRVILTASGGPFRTTPAEELATVTPAQALRHPTWNMGSKITIDSATLMNKALEVVEARWLFDLRREQIDAVVHPQSIVHSMVEFQDGSILAQMGVPDMAVPIRYALSYPERSRTEQSYFDLERFRSLNFEAPDLERFPGLRLGFEVARLGGTYGAVLNAANEVAVDLFLRAQIPFPAIARTVEHTLEQHDPVPEPDLEEILAADQWAREEAAACHC